MFKEVDKFSTKVFDYKDVITNEAQTRTVLVEPFLKLLGYDATNPFEVILEYSADVGVKRGEKVDYAIKVNGEIGIIIEVKCRTSTLNARHINQLYRYFATTDAKIAILTNGLDYWFFTDSVKTNIMDDTPFYKINIIKITSREFNYLKDFIKDTFYSRNTEQTIQNNKLSVTIEEYNKIAEEDNEVIEENTRNINDLNNLKTIIATTKETRTAKLRELMGVRNVTLVKLMKILIDEKWLEIGRSRHKGYKLVAKEEELEKWRR